MTDIVSIKIKQFNFAKVGIVIVVLRIVTTTHFNLTPLLQWSGRVSTYLQFQHNNGVPNIGCHTVELQLSELMGTGTHSDNQIIRIIGVFLIKIAIGEKKKLRFDIALFFY